MRLIAAVDQTPAARPVLETALGLAALLGAQVEAVHAAENGAAAALAECEALAVPLRVLRGPVVPSILGVLAESDVHGAVVGARARPGGRRAIGHTALQIVAGAAKPVVVVPPEACGECPRSFRRVLVPLDGTYAAARPVQDLVPSLESAGLRVVVMHVFDADTTPRFVDHDTDLDLWAREFLARFYSMPGAEVELRVGSPGPKVVEVAQSCDADLVVLSWSRDASAGHATVIQEVLARSTVPVLLLPIVVEPAAARL